MNVEGFKDKIVHNDTEIKGFFEAYRYLSNFHPTPVVLFGLVFSSSEAAFMAAKCEDPDERKLFVGIAAKDAKLLGRKVKLKSNWEEIKEYVMFEVNWQKYYYNKELGRKLIATGDRYLEETNWWGDKFWGVSDGEGNNKLGQILMDIRGALVSLEWDLNTSYLD